MKKMVSLLIIAIPILAYGAIGDTFEYVSTEGLNLTFKITSEARKEVQFGMGVSNYLSIDTTYEGRIVIPDEVNGYRVTAIAPYAFKNCRRITEIILPEDAVTIGEYAFSHCEQAKNIKLSSNVTAIESHTFAYCHGLTTFYIPANVTTIGEYAFAGCDNLWLLGLSKKLTSIASHAFANCSALPFVIFPDSLETIGEYAFSECQGLSMIEIPDQVTKIGERAFQNCYDCEFVIIGTSVNKIGNYAFRSCKSLESIILKSTVPFSIAKASFFYSTSSNTRDLLYENVTLYVPTLYENTYKNSSNWKNFKHIEGVNIEEKIEELIGGPTNINKTEVNVSSSQARSYYSLDGKQSTKPFKGLNIIKKQNGEVRKVIIK